MDSTTAALGAESLQPSRVSALVEFHQLPVWRRTRLALRTAVALAILALACGQTEALPSGDAGPSCLPSPEREPPRFVRRFGGTGNETPFQALLTPDGGSLTTGPYEGSPDFGLGVLPDPGTTGLFLLKLDSTGQPLWNRTFGMQTGEFSLQAAITSDGGVVLTASFSGTLDFGGGALASVGEHDIAVARLDASGEHVWSRRLGGAEDEFFAHASLTQDDGIVLSGRLGGATDLGTGPLGSVGTPSTFVARLDADGTTLWARTYAPARGVAAHVDPTGGIVAIGTFIGALDMGAGAVASAGQEDLFVTRLDDAGNPLWTKRFGGPGQDLQRGFVDAAGRIFLKGWFTGTADFGGVELTSAGGYDFVVARLDPSGLTDWARRFGGPKDEVYIDAAPDNLGGVALAGSFQGTLDLGGGPLDAAHFYDGYVAKLDGSGGHVWSQRFGCQGVQQAQSVAVGSSGASLLAGNFENSIDLGAGAMVAAGGHDIFIATLAP
jgi:outer membrane protein assembly factor BamB